MRIEPVADVHRTITFVVEEKPHPRLERAGDDLVVKLNITLSQALLGPEGGGSITKEVDQLDGRRVQVTLPEGVSQHPSFQYHQLTPSSKSFNRDRRRE